MYNQQDQQSTKTPNSSDQPTTGVEERDQEDDESSTPPSGELTAANEDPNASERQAAEPVRVATDQMTEEEARKLLQSIRDRDMLRRLRKQAAERALRVPVERDW